MPAGDPRQEHLRELSDVPEFYRMEIEHFFLIYKELEPGKSVEGASWADRAAAEGGGGGVPAAAERSAGARQLGEAAATSEAAAPRRTPRCR